MLAKAIADNVEDSWAIVERFTQAMRAAADTQDWLHVLNLAGDRHQQLLQHFQHFPVGPENARFYQVRLHSMLKGEQDLQRIATDARREVMREGLLTNHNYKAVGAYLAS